MPPHPAGDEIRQSALFARAIAYGTLTGHLTRTLNAPGLKREPIDVTPALHEYLDMLQPAEPQDLVAVAAEDKNEG